MAAGSDTLPFFLFVFNLQLGGFALLKCLCAAELKLHISKVHSSSADPSAQDARAPQFVVAQIDVRLPARLKDVRRKKNNKGQDTRGTQPPA